VQPAGLRRDRTAIKAAAVAADEKEEKMRVLTPYELSMMTRPELNAMLCQIAAQVPHLPANSAQLRIAHANLQAIRRAMLPRPGGPRP
jgi:hypothetical protein